MICFVDLYPAAVELQQNTILLSKLLLNFFFFFKNLIHNIVILKDLVNKAHQIMIIDFVIFDRVLYMDLVHNKNNNIMWWYRRDISFYIRTFYILYWLFTVITALIIRSCFMVHVFNLDTLFNTYYNTMWTWRGIEKSEF